MRDLTKEESLLVMDLTTKFKVKDYQLWSDMIEEIMKRLHINHFETVEKIVEKYGAF